MGDAPQKIDLMEELKRSLLKDAIERLETVSRSGGPFSVSVHVSVEAADLSTLLAAYRDVHSRLQRAEQDALTATEARTEAFEDFFSVLVGLADTKDVEANGPNPGLTRRSLAHVTLTMNEILLAHAKLLRGSTGEQGERNG